MSKMLVLKDPQGHTFEATEEAVTSGVACPECSWRCGTHDVVATKSESTPVRASDTTKRLPETEE